MFCKKCGQEIDNDSEFCKNCGTEQKNEETTEPNDEENSKKSGCLKYIALFLFVIIAILLVAFIQLPKNEKDEIFKRDADNHNITVDYDIDIKNLEMELTITPNVDIEDLTLCIIYYDEDDNFIKRQYKYIGNVEKEETIEKIVHLTNLTLEEALKIYDIEISVSEGKVNKFADNFANY